MRSAITNLKRRSQLLLLAICLMSGMISEVRAQVVIQSENDRLIRLPRPTVSPEFGPSRPVPSAPYWIEKLRIDSSISQQVARVQVTQQIKNVSNRTIQASFVFPLPYDGAVDRMTFLVDGKEYDAKLLDAKEARSIYENYVRQNQDPALLEFIGNGMFRTSVFPIPANASRTVTIRYSQVCRKYNGLTEWTFPLRAAQFTTRPIGSFELVVNVVEESKIKNIYSPSHSLEMKRTSAESATVKVAQKHVIPTSDFRLFYDTSGKQLGVNVLSYRPDKSEPGYFMLLAAPDIQLVEPPTRKSIVFVVDRSGSMSGEKMDQAKQALIQVLNGLNPDDLFNIVAYDTDVEVFQPEMQKFNDSRRKQAIGFVHSLFAGGSTNISGALTQAVSMMQDDRTPSYVVFLTDGIPTAGIKDSAAIVKSVVMQNRVDARVFSFGVGYDVNSRLLDKLSRECGGVSTFVRPNEDIEAPVAQLYNQISSPVMTNIKLSFENNKLKVENGKVINRVYPRGDFDMFAGQQVVLVGRYRKAGNFDVVLDGELGGDNVTLHYKARLTDYSSNETNSFVEKIWAMRRIGEIIDDIDLNGENDELVDELVKLSTRHGIITPYTAFLADETSSILNHEANFDRTRRELSQLGTETGLGGVAQRAAKGELQRAGNENFGFEAADAPAGFATRPGGMGGLGGGRQAKFRDLETDEEVTVESVRNIGAKTFYLRNGVWVDSVVTEGQLKKVSEIKRFGDAYFKFVEKHGKKVARYLQIPEPVIIVVEGAAYQF